MQSGDQNIKSLKCKCDNFTHGCEWEGELRCLEEQHKFFCEYQTVPCMYADIGCKVKMLWKDIKEHEMNWQDHLELAVEAALGNKKTIENNASELEKSLHEISTRVTDKQESTTAYLQSIILAQSKELNEIRSVIARQSDTTSGYHSDQVSPTVLKFTNFTKRKSCNEVTYSPPFYSSPGGYKMCLRVYAKGFGDGKDTHVSVHVYLLRGENDDHLTWPFTGTVEIELLNQLNDKIHQKVTIQFMGDQKSSQRVENSDRATFGCGYNKFISHSSLAITNNLWGNQCQYLKDDSLYFRYKVTCETPKPWLTAASVF